MIRRIVVDAKGVQLRVVQKARSFYVYTNGPRQFAALEVRT